MTKRCSRCTFVKCSSEFGKRRSTSDGLDWYCRECQRAIAATRRADFAAEKLAYDRKWRKENKAAVLRASRRWHANNVERERRENLARYHAGRA